MRPPERVRQLLTGILRAVHGWSERALDALHAEAIAAPPAPGTHSQGDASAAAQSEPYEPFAEEEAFGGPPAHWLEKVRRGAPGLLLAMDPRLLAPSPRRARTPDSSDFAAPVQHALARHEAPPSRALRTEGAVARAGFEARGVEIEAEAPVAPTSVRTSDAARVTPAARAAAPSREVRAEAPDDTPVFEAPQRVERTHARPEREARTNRETQRVASAPLAQRQPDTNQPAPVEPPASAAHVSSEARARPSVQRVPEPVSWSDQEPRWLRTAETAQAARGERATPPAVSRAPELVLPAQARAVSPPPTHVAQRSVEPVHVPAPPAAHLGQVAPPVHVTPHPSLFEPARAAIAPPSDPDPDLASSRWAPLPSSRDAVPEELRRRQLAHELARAARLADEQRRL